MVCGVFERRRSAVRVAMCVAWCVVNRPYVRTRLHANVLTLPLRSPPFPVLPRSVPPNRYTLEIDGMVDEFCREGGFVELRRKEVAQENAAGAVVR